MGLYLRFGLLKVVEQGPDVYSVARFVAPITFVGLTALSVDIATNLYFKFNGDGRLLLCPEYVCDDGGRRVALHHWDVFACGRVEYDIRPCAFKYLAHFCLVAHGVMTLLIFISPFIGERVRKRSFAGVSACPAYDFCT